MISLAKNLLDNPRVRVLLLVVLVTLGIFLRFQYFNDEGGDHRTYKKAVTTYLQGENPYKYTVESFQDRTLKKGYAYLPTLLYVQTFLVKINELVDGNWATKHMWKIPVFLADVGIVVLLARQFFKKDYVFALVAAGFWLFNPHLIMRQEYVLYDPLAILFLLWSFVVSQDRGWLRGVLYAVAISFKTYPIVLFPLIFLKTKNKRHFLLGGALVALVISIPFLHDIETYLRGTLFVHGDRGVQGRPLLTFLSYYGYRYGINFYQSIYHQVYSVLALVLPWILGVLFYFRKKGWSLFQLSLFPVLAYTLFTPVWNRTHVLWFLPLLLTGLYEFLRHSTAKLYVVIFGVFIFLSGYLYLWNSGFKIYNCDMLSVEPSEKASTRTCNKLDTFGISHCPLELGRCLPHCCEE